VEGNPLANKEVETSPSEQIIELVWCVESTSANKAHRATQS
jgi:hypothetical protein